MPLKPEKDRVIWCEDQQRWELVTQEKFDELAKNRQYALGPISKVVTNAGPIHMNDDNQFQWDILKYTLPHCSC